MEYIAKFDYKTYADTTQLARLKSGFLLKEIMDHFSQKINSTLKPDRSMWLYSGSICVLIIKKMLAQRNSLELLFLLFLFSLLT